MMAKLPVFRKELVLRKFRKIGCTVRMAKNGSHFVLNHKGQTATIAFTHKNEARPRDLLDKLSRIGISEFEFRAA